MKLNINRTGWKASLLACISLLLMVSWVSAQTNPPDTTNKRPSDPAAAQNDTISKNSSGSSSPFTAPVGTFSKRGFAGAPYIKYAPETGWMGGLVGIYYFHLGSDTSERLTRPSDVSGGVRYSQKHQFLLGIDYNLYTARDEYLINGGFHYQQIPIDFYGIGNYTPADRIDNYTPLYRGLEFYATHKFIRTEQGDGLNTGIEAEFRNDKVLSTTSDTSIITRGLVPGAAGGVSNGTGAIIIYDTRDNIYSTQSGQYGSFDAEFYGRTLGSDYTFSRYTLDARQFVPITNNQTFAAQLYGVLANGIVPFYEMAQLGGDSKLRGYYQGRFRDNDLALLQAEYRFPIWWRFGGVVFGGAGEVGHTVSDFTFHGLHPSYGAGLRLLVIPAEHLNARLDYGIGTDSKGLYLAILEAF